MKSVFTGVALTVGLCLCLPAQGTWQVVVRSRAILSQDLGGQVRRVPVNLDVMVPARTEWLEFLKASKLVVYSGLAIASAHLCSTVLEGMALGISAGAAYALWLSFLENRIKVRAQSADGATVELSFGLPWIFTLGLVNNLHSFFPPRREGTPPILLRLDAEASIVGYGPSASPHHVRQRWIAGEIPGAMPELGSSRAEGVLFSSVLDLVTDAVDSEEL